MKKTVLEKINDTKLHKKYGPLQADFFCLIYYAS
jgi:hypothetical protein